MAERAGEGNFSVETYDYPKAFPAVAAIQGLIELIPTYALEPGTVRAQKDRARLGEHGVFVGPVFLRRLRRH